MESVNLRRARDQGICRVLVLLVVLFTSNFVASCKRQVVDLRAFAPAETVIYLESRDIGKILTTITQNEHFQNHSDIQLDLSMFEGVQIAVAITDFEASEKRVTDQQSILNLTPKFVALAETHAWSWQMNAIIENGVHKFVQKAYGEDVKIEKTEGTRSNRYSWTSTEGRKAFAAVSGTQIFFGNDEGAINKSLLAKNGDSESLLKNEALGEQYAKSKKSIAFGYVSRKGVEKVSELFGVSVAVRQSEDENVRGVISRVLPKIMRNTVEEIVWTANLKSGLVADKVLIKTSKETSEVLSETIKPASEFDRRIFDLLPKETQSVTQYNLKNPQIAFRSLLLMIARNVDVLEKNLIAASSDSLLEPYGISKAEEFLSKIDSSIVTVQLDGEGEKSFVIARTKKIEEIKKTISAGIDFRVKPQIVGDSNLWKSRDESFSFAAIGNWVLFGESKSVSKAINMANRRALSPIEPEKDFVKGKTFQDIVDNAMSSSTYSTDRETLGKLVNILGHSRNQSTNTELKNVTKTRFTIDGIERIYISDFGIIGTIVKQFDSE